MEKARAASSSWFHMAARTHMAKFGVIFTERHQKIRVDVWREQPPWAAAGPNQNGPNTPGNWNAGRRSETLSLGPIFHSGSTAYITASLAKSGPVRYSTSSPSAPRRPSLRQRTGPVSLLLTLIHSGIQISRHSMIARQMQTNLFTKKFSRLLGRQRARLHVSYDLRPISRRPKFYANESPFLIFRNISLKLSSNLTGKFQWNCSWSHVLSSWIHSVSHAREFFYRISADSKANNKDRTSVSFLAAATV